MTLTTPLRELLGNLAVPLLDVVDAAEKATHDATYASVWDSALDKDVCANLHGDCPVCVALAALRSALAKEGLA